ncbi:MAG TPA: hypothetical protein VNA25_04520 [Phycisphaerae bacterium]|nr:hypothetical protein [Phycisphaerae bacterium]
MSNRSRRAGFIAAALIAAVMCGCSKEITIIRYPPFWTPQLKSIAVVPFKFSDRQAGQMIADQLANSLRATGTYRVFNSTEVADMARMQDMQIAFGDDQVAMAAQIRKISTLNVQAILIGRITNYTATKRDERRREPVQVWDPRTKQYVPSGQYRSFVVTRNEGNVAATAAMIRVKDGTTIHATAAPKQWLQWAQGSPPPMDAYACRSIAVSRVVNQLVEEFAVVRKKIKIKPDETFMLARDYYEGEWAKTKQFSTADPKLTVVLSLPPVCDRNRFRITIVRKGQRENLAEADVLWSSRFPQYGKAYDFSPAEIASKGGGPGQYTAKLYSGMEPKPILTIDFTIQP